MGYKINIRNALDSGWNNLLQDEYIEHDFTTTGIGTSATDNVELALKWLYDNTDKSTGLEKITEGGHTGWRLIGKNPNSYGNIGNNAVDLSYSVDASTTYGATGSYSHAEGYETTASGDDSSHAEGHKTTASGYTSHAEGFTSTAGPKVKRAPRWCEVPGDGAYT